MSELFEGNSQHALFDVMALPYGLVYRPDFLSVGEEETLLDVFASLPFHEARFQQYFARRRVVHFHGPEHVAAAAAGDDDVASSGELPPAVAALRERVADWLGIASGALVHALVSEYRPGTPIGWHRDKPVYGTVVGVSLRGRAVMRYRPMSNVRYHARNHVFALNLEPRSAYIMQGPIRWDWQHSMPAVKELRYSVTFRTLAIEAPVNTGVTSGYHA